jgi:hypothetical protein
LAAFCDELEKIAAARLHGKGVLSVRKGRRPISAANLLRKEKDGKLSKFQHVKEAERSLVWKGKAASKEEIVHDIVTRIRVAAGVKEAATGGDSAGQPDDVSGGWEDDGAAKKPKRRGEVPTEVKSTTMSTKEGAFFDRARSLGAGAVKHVQEHAAHAAKEHLHAGVDEIAAAMKPHIHEATHHLITAGNKAQMESAGEVGRHAGRAAVDSVKADAKKVWDDHKGKILGGAAAAYGANKAIDYSIQKHAALFDELEKISTVPGAMGSVNPFTTGENPMSSPETRKKPSPGDIPSEGWEGLQDKPLNPSQMTGPGVYATPANKMKRKGDVPTKEKDPSAVDRLDGRGEATTVTGLAQNSNNIGAIGSGAEHVG